MPWSKAEVLARAAEWTWDPPGTKVVEGEAFRLSHRPSGYRSSIVHWCRPRDEAEARELVEALIEETKAQGKERLLWWLRPGDAPESLVDILSLRGFELVDRTDILDWDLTGDCEPMLPVVASDSGVRVELANDVASFTDFHRISANVFSHPMPTKDAIVREAAENARSDRYFSFLAYLNGFPVACAGLTVAGDVGRLWGAATLPEHRGKGAYKTLVVTRLRKASQSGATLGLVRGKVGTSGPILERMGFRRVGSDRCFALPLAPGEGLTRT